MSRAFVMHYHRFWTLFVLIIIFGTRSVDPRNRVCSHRCSKCEDGHCKECYYGYWGHDCQHDCQNCWLGGCFKRSGRCVQCKPGLHGETCRTPCSVNCRSSDRDKTVYCKRHNGKCLEGCNSGWWGSSCLQKCSSGCQESCFQDDGACISECRAGYFGTHCNQLCSEGCILGTCDWLTGNCIGGCKCGYSGDTCRDKCSENCKTSCKYDSTRNCLACPSECKDGWTSAGCNVTCGKDCTVCDQFSTKCLQCKRGLYGRQCDTECNEHCIASKCGQNGKCTEGCTEGYHGARCRHKCPSDCTSCNRHTRGCTFCSITCNVTMYNDVHKEDQTSDDANYQLQGASTQDLGFGLTTDLLLVTFALFIGHPQD